MFASSGGMHLHRVHDTALLYALYITNSDYAAESVHQIPFVEAAFKKAVADVSWVERNPTAQAEATLMPRMNHGGRRVGS